MIGQEEKAVNGIISPFYALFSLAALYLDENNIILLFLIGALWSSVINIFLSSIDKVLVVNISPKWFGLLNIFNYYVLNRVFDNFILKSSYQSIIFLFVFGVSLALVDLSISLRKLIAG